MDVLEAIYTTRAMRRLAPDPIPAELLPQLFDAAIRGPNSGNTQLFRFICVTDPAMKKTMQGIYSECLEELNATRYAGTQKKIAKGDPEDPKVQQAMLVNKSARWLAENLHVAPMLIFVSAKRAARPRRFRACGTCA